MSTGAREQQSVPGRLPGGSYEWEACRTRHKSYWPCRCAPCAVCGNGPHTAIHGPRGDDKPGPWGHEYTLNPTESDTPTAPLPIVKESLERPPRGEQNDGQ